MRTVHVVAIETGQPPVLPRLCFLCGKAGIDPLTSIRMSDENGRVDFYLYGLIDEPAQGDVLPVPVHDACARSLRNRCLARLLAIVLGWAAAVSAGVMLDLDAWLVLALATIAATPFLYLEFTRPVPFEFWFSGAKYRLAFSDRKFAQQVARLNDAEVIESTLGGGY
jgi:hypothetical protein